MRTNLNCKKALTRLFYEKFLFFIFLLCMILNLIESFEVIKFFH